MKGKASGKLDLKVPERSKNRGYDANYDIAKQNEPVKRMGNGSYANLPSAPIMKSFGRSHDYISGVVNRYDCGLENVSGIDENRP